MGRLPYGSPTMETRVAKAEDCLRKSKEGKNQDHVLRQLFPPTIKRHYYFRHRAHNFELPTKDDIYFSRIPYEHIKCPSK